MNIFFLPLKRETGKARNFKFLKSFFLTGKLWSKRYFLINPFKNSKQIWLKNSDGGGKGGLKSAKNCHILFE
jgi:hypothetical protein